MNNYSFFLPFLFFLISCNGCMKKNPSSTDTSYAIEKPSTADVRFPGISVGDDKESVQKISYSFKFEDREYKIRVAVDRNVYESARNTKKVMLVPENTKEEDLSAGYQLGLIDDAAQKSFYEELIAAFRHIRDKDKLDDDRYMEMMITFVQQIRYCNERADNPKYPIEIFVDKCGDCDDKSRLLAALLSKEGYETALLLFTKESHMAVGIKASPLNYKKTKYAYVETTSPALVGFLADESTTNVRIVSSPEVVRVGGGKKKYGSGLEVKYLADVLSEMKGCVDEVKSELSEIEIEVRKHEKDIARLQEEVDRSVRGSSDDKASAVKKYNEGAERFNAVVNERNSLANELNGCAEVYNYILRNAHNRSGLYKWVRNRLD